MVLGVLAAYFLHDEALSGLCYSFSFFYFQLYSQGRLLLSSWYFNEMNIRKE